MKQWLMIGTAMLTLLTACAETTASGDSGCVSYSIARLTIPDLGTDIDANAEWIADTDTRMTATCRWRVT